MISGKLTLGISFALAAGAYYIHDPFLSGSDAVTTAYYITEASYAGENIACAPLNNLRSFSNQEDRETAEWLLANIDDVPIGTELLNNLEDRWSGQTTLCFSDSLNDKDRGSVTGFQHARNLVIGGETVYSRTSITLTRTINNKMLATLAHELEHSRRARLLDSWDKWGMPDNRRTLLTLSGEAIARTTSVQMALEFESQGNTNVLNDIYGCENSETCSNTLVRAYLDNNSTKDISEPIYRTMLAWLTPENIHTYTQGRNVSLTMNLSIDITDSERCERIAAEYAPDFKEVDVEDRSLVARYIRPSDRSFFEAPASYEYARANTLVNQVLQNISIAENCANEEENPTASSGASAPAQP